MSAPLTPTLEIEGMASVKDGKFGVDPGLLLDPDLLEAMREYFDGRQVRITVQVIATPEF